MAHSLQKRAQCSVFFHRYSKEIELFHRHTDQCVCHTVPVHHFLQQFVHKAVRHSVQPRHALAPGRCHRHPIGIEFIVHRAAVQISTDLPGVRQLHRVTVDPLFVLHIPHTGAVAEYNII